MSKKSIAISLAAPLVAGLIALASAGGLAFMFADFAPAPWSSAGSMAEARSGASSALLPDGRVLVTGGSGANGLLNSAEMYSLDGGFSPEAPMALARTGHVSVAMGDGRVLVAGGTTTGGGITNSAEIFDPVTSSWSEVPGGMIEPRTGATASFLQDGRVLIAGGANSSGGVSSTVEIFNPATNTFAMAGPLSSPRQNHAAAVLPDGRVLITGGSDGKRALATTDIFDPATDSVNPGPALLGARQRHSATTLLDGSVLIAGGSDGSTDLATAEVCNPVTGAVSAVGNLAVARSGHLAFLLPNNNAVLIVGGTSGGAALASAELYTPASQAFAPAGSLSAARSAAVGTALQSDGWLLVAGGTDGSNVLPTAELYHFATVRTNLGDYSPGQKVYMSGSGWQPGETVTLQLQEVPAGDVHAPITATADSSGKILTNQFAPDDNDLGVRFYLTATGASSGLRAYATFTDGNPKINKVLPNAGPVAGGTIVRIKIGNFADAPGLTYTVTFSNGKDSTSVSGTRAGNSTLTATTPACPGTCTASQTRVGITVTSSNGDSASDNNAFTYTGSAANTAPTADDFTTTVNENGTVTITLTGHDAQTKELKFYTPDTGYVYGSPYTDDTLTAPAHGTLSNFTDQFGTGSPGAYSDTATLTYQPNSNFSGTDTFTFYVADSDGLYSDEATVTITINAVASKLAFSSSAVSGSVGACLGPLTVQVQDGGGNAVAVSSNTSVSLTTGSAGGAFYSDAACGSGITAVTIPANSSSASFYYKDTSAGSPTITASSGTLTQATQVETITKASTTTAVATNNSTASYGQEVTLTATVTPSAATGSVQFAYSTDGGATFTNITGGSVTLSAGQAQLVTQALPAGTTTVQATYAGDSNYTGSSGTAAQSVGKATASFSSLTASQSVPYGTASVTLSGKLTGTPVNPPSGSTVSVSIGTGTASGTGTTDASGHFSVTVSTASLDASATPYTISYSYGATTNFAGATDGTTTLTVTAAKTTTSITPSSISKVYGVGDTFTATVENIDTNATPAGSVKFTVSNGSATVGTFIASVSGSGNTVTATFPLSDLSGFPLPAGSYAVTAEFVPSPANFTASSSDAASLTITKATPLFSNLSAPAIYYGATPTSLGGTISYTVGSAVYYPTGNVSITVNGVAKQAAIGTNGVFSVSFDTSVLGVSGSPYTITYSYSGDSNFTSLTDTTKTLKVAAARTTTNISPLNDSKIYRVDDTFTATVKNTDTGATPAGSVTFTVTSGTVTLVTLTPSFGGSGNAATATFKLSDLSSPLPVGSYTITAEFIPSSNFAESRASTSFTVLKRPTTIVYGGPAEAMYGDCLTTFTAVLTDTTTSTALPGESITFKITDSAQNVVATGTATTDSTGTATVSIPLNLNAATYSANASFDGDAIYALSATGNTGNFKIQNSTYAGPVAGQPLYTGSPIFWTANSTSSTATMTLSAVIQDTGKTFGSQICYGDIRTARLTFAFRNGDGSYTPISNQTANLPVGLVDPANPHVGTASTIVQYNLGNSSYDSFQLAVIAKGNYDLNQISQDSEIGVAVPGTPNSIVGAGSLDLRKLTASGPSTTSTYPAASGFLGNAIDDNNPLLWVTANVTYNKSNTNPQGNVVVRFSSFNKPDGTVDTKLHNYLIKSNSIASLAALKSGDYSFTAKATVQDQDTGTSLDGGATMQVTLTSGTPGLIAISVQSSKKGGPMWISTAWDPSKGTTVEKQLQPNSQITAN